MGIIENIAFSGTNTTTISISNEGKVVALHVLYTSDATVGNRQLAVEYTDGTNELMSVHAGAYQAASGTNQHYSFQGGVYREATFFAGSLQVPIPINFTVPSGGQIIVRDVNAVSVGDSFTGYVQIERNP